MIVPPVIATTIDGIAEMTVKATAETIAGMTAETTAETIAGMTAETDVTDIKFKSPSLNLTGNIYGAASAAPLYFLPIISYCIFVT